MAKTSKNAPKTPASRGFFIFILLALILLGFFNLFSGNKDVTITYSEFKQKIILGEIKQVKITNSSLLGSTITLADQKALDADSLHTLIKPSNAGSFVIYKTVPVRDEQLIPLLDQYGVNYHGELPRNYDFIFTFILFGSLIFFMFILPRILGKKMGGANPMSFGQSKGRIVAETELLTKFSDVAGCDESKYELAEIVDFLKNPKLYTDIGGKIPRGALLIGPPGTGKTLLARAVAGEAGVTFFKMSGADFVEMFVGVGAARVRDLFSQARLKAPSIIFIDEIDAIGKSRANSLNNNDEREQTLNQLLVEMDGFEASSGVIVLAATNRPEILDSALLRTGRFDRQIMVDRPDINGREDILKIHSANVKLDSSVNLHEVAVATPGLVGSDLANIVNEAALLAVRAKRLVVTQEDFNEAIEKSAIGLAKRTRVMSRFERENTAYHEVGHALVNVFTANSDPLRKVSIVPRGFALGVTWSSPIEGRYSKTEEELIAYIDITLGGRGAEQIIYSRITTGASNDIQQATETARSMIMDYGMSQRFMNVSFRGHSNSFTDGRNSKEYSENTQQYIDDEISKLINSRYNHVLALLTKHKELLLQITAIILHKESLSGEEFLDIVKSNMAGAQELEEVASRSLNASQLELNNFEKQLGD